MHVVACPRMQCSEVSAPQVKAGQNQAQWEVSLHPG